MNEKEMKYILQEIKKANYLSELAFEYLERLNERQFSLTMFRITEINEILTNLEINLEIKLKIDANYLNKLKGDKNE